MGKTKALARSVMAGTIAAALVTACSAKTLPYPGGLMIAVQTDYVAPKDVTAVGLFISSDGKPIFGDTREVAPTGEVKFPATIAVIADENRPKATIKIRAVAFKRDGKVRVLRDAITTVPRGRTAVLKTPLLWINEGSGTGSRSDLVSGASLAGLGGASNVQLRDAVSDGFTRLQSTCPNADETFIDGRCQGAQVDADALPEYHEEDVYGGGKADGSGGKCYDVKACFTSSVTAAIDDMTGCSTKLAGGHDPNDAKLSFSLALSPTPEDGEDSVGECLAGGPCLIALSKGTDWSVVNGAVQFLPAFCDKIAAGKALGMIASFACPSKTDAIPACGAASAVGPEGAETPVGDAGPPLDASDLFDATASETEDAAADATTEPPDASEPITDGSTAIDATVGSDAGTTKDAQVPPFDSSVPVADAEGPPAEFGTPEQTTEYGPTDLLVTAPEIAVARSGINTPTRQSPGLVSFTFPPPTATLRWSLTPGTTLPFFRMSGPLGLPIIDLVDLQSTLFYDCKTDQTQWLCVSFSLFTAPTAVASSSSRTFIGGVYKQGGPPLSYYDIGGSNPQGVTNPQLPTTGTVEALAVSTGQPAFLYIGYLDGSIYRCTLPCDSTSAANSLMSAGGSMVSAIATYADPGKGNNVFYLTSSASGTPFGIYRLPDPTTFSTGQTATLIVGPASLGTTPSGTGKPATALAVDSRYVYFSSDNTLGYRSSTVSDDQGLWKTFAGDTHPIINIVTTSARVYWVTGGPSVQGSVVSVAKLEKF